MKKEVIVKDEEGKNITISVVGEFKIDELDKDYMIYSAIDDDNNNPEGNIIIGEIIKEEDTIKVVGIKEDERNIVLKFYQEISNQLGNE